MTQPFDEQRYLNVLARWRMLAQRRLADLTREYESGRWKRYFSEPEILHLLHEAKKSADVWMKISPPSDIAPTVAAPAAPEVRTPPPLVVPSKPVVSPAIAA